MLRILTILIVALSLSSTARAATFNFDVTWDGSSLTETSVGSGLTSTIMNNGDNFSLTIRAAGDGYWTSLAGAENILFPLNPRTFGSSQGDVTATLSNDGSTVFVDSAIESRCCGELGFNYWEGIAPGTVFDLIVMDYTLITGEPKTIFSNGTSTTSFWNSDASPFSTASYDYTDVPSSVVPLPAGGLLLLTAIGGLGLARFRRA